MTPPYYAVIFTSTQTDQLEGYKEMADSMEALAKKQPGYLGMEHAKEELGITISYWETKEDIARWKANIDHQQAQKLGREQWYASYRTRICLVERDYKFDKH